MIFFLNSVQGGGEEKKNGAGKQQPLKLSPEHAGMMLELQNTFLYLQHGSMEYYDAKQLVLNSKTLNLLNDVLHQNDVRDYIDKLLDRLEEHFEKHDTNVTAPGAPSSTASAGKGAASKFASRYKGQWAYETRRYV